MWLLERALSLVSLLYPRSTLRGRTGSWREGRTELRAELGSSQLQEGWQGVCRKEGR